MPEDPATVELVKVTYPDPLFRPIPPFSIDVPPEWLVTEFPDALFLMAPADDAPGPWSNVIVRHERVFPGESFEGIAAATWKSLQSLYPEVTLRDERVLKGKQLFYVREVGISLPDRGGPVARFDAFLFGRVLDQPTVDLYQFTFLTPDETVDEMKLLYLRMLLSVDFVD